MKFALHNPNSLRCQLLIICVLTIADPGVLAQPIDSSRWHLEEITTKDGKKYRGLVYAEGDGEVEFIEVVRPRGKPMYLVVRPVAQANIATLQRLPAEKHKLLAQRVYAFRFHSRIEAGRMENIQLDPREDDGREFLRYRGPWFTLDSTANDELTRRCIVRTEQIFRAYRQMLPPRAEAEIDLPERPLRIVLFASLDEYRTYLKQHGLAINNPAIYSQRGNTVVVGGELSLFAERLATTRTRHQSIREQYEQLDKQMDMRLASIRAELKKAGVVKRQIDDEINARKAQWKGERDEVLLQLNAADRRNDRRFDELTEAMFARLYHEALHAYIENYLYPHREFDVPVWLHEGLAQFFQSGRLEADTLRIDSPLSPALLHVQHNIRSGRALSMVELLEAQRSDFLSGANRQQMYAHAWALVYYLAIERGVLGTESLDDIVPRVDDADADRDGAEVARFQTLVDQSLLDFEQQWHTAMLALTP